MGGHDFVWYRHVGHGEFAAMLDTGWWRRVGFVWGVQYSDDLGEGFCCRVWNLDGLSGLNQAEEGRVDLETEFCVEV